MSPDIPDFCEIVVDNECQIWLAAAEVENGYFVKAAFWKAVVNKLNEAVNLLVFVIFAPDYFKILWKNTEVNERRNVFPSRRR